MKKKMDICLNSEIGKLNGVIIHSPGAETENMTPNNAEKALYSDILNLSVCLKEYAQFKVALQSMCEVFETRDLLEDILKDIKIRTKIIREICSKEEAFYVEDFLLEQTPKKLSSLFIEGALKPQNNLTRFLNKERYSLKPLHNFFFMRDASVSIYDEVLISKMANIVRNRESLIMETIFNHHPLFQAKTFNPEKSRFADKINIEGGDVLIARPDLLLIGIGSRTNTRGVDFLIEKFKKEKRQMNILVQELPTSPESFIHLDMVFTFLDVNQCMIYEPVVLQPNRYKTVLIKIENGKVVSINEEKNILETLNSKLNFDIEAIKCGGSQDSWIQEREQWHSGANFLALAPGKVIGYGRNINTIEELNKHGYEIITAKDIMKGKKDPNKSKKCVITIDGSELSRGGGGCRCMSMPVNRDKVDW